MLPSGCNACIRVLSVHTVQELLASMAQLALESAGDTCLSVSQDSCRGWLGCMRNGSAELLPPAGHTTAPGPHCAVRSPPFLPPGFHVGPARSGDERREH